MALGTLATALAPAAISAGTSLLGGLFGGGDEAAPPPPPTGINAGGLRSSLAGGNLNITASPERTGLVGSIADTFGQLGGELGALRSSVAPGVSGLRASRLGEIENARNRAIGDLRENLERRRVLGSSFGSDAITRAESEFAGQRERVAAESFLQELELTNNLINQQYNAQRQQFQTSLTELNLQADLATKLATKATDTLSANARFEQSLAALEAQNAGKFFGKIGDQLGRGFTSAYGGSGINLSQGSPGMGGLPFA